MNANDSAWEPSSWKLQLPRLWGETRPHSRSFAVSFPLLSFLLAGCEPAPTPPPPQTPPPEQQVRRELDNRTEVMHQTREVIRYVDEEQRLKEKELQERGLESPR